MRVFGTGARVFGAVLLLAGAAACSNPADQAPDAQVHEAETPAAAVDGLSLPIGAGSKIGFVGSKVTGSHEGGFESFTGEVVVVGDDPTRSQVRIEIDTTSLWSDDDRLTGHLKSADFFDVEQFPTASFTSTAIEAAGDGFDITGNLDLHGVTKSITFPASIAVAGGQVTAEAEFSIKRFDFGIVYPGRADDLIRDEVLVTFSLTAGS